MKTHNLFTRKNKQEEHYITLCFKLASKRRQMPTTSGNQVTRAHGT